MITQTLARIIKNTPFVNGKVSKIKGLSKAPRYMLIVDARSKVKVQVGGVSYSRGYYVRAVSAECEWFGYYDHSIVETKLITDVEIEGVKKRGLYDTFIFSVDFNLKPDGGVVIDGGWYHMKLTKIDIDAISQGIFL